jgi:hypothetical protein
MKPSLEKGPKGGKGRTHGDRKEEHTEEHSDGHTSTTLEGRLMSQKLEKYRGERKGANTEV